jgi:hypothetical protein
LPVVVPLPYRFNARRRGNERENLRRQQIVMQYDVGVTENPQRLQRQQVGIAGTCADEIDHAFRT